jgi:ATP-dependent DNA helicase PIF1
MAKREIIFETIFQHHKNVFITAGGGSGKSFLLRELYQSSSRYGFKPKEVTLVSTTGISAYNIEGQTIHSWCGILLPNGITEMDSETLGHTVTSIIRRSSSRKNAIQIKQTKLLLIDEVSMLGGFYLEILDKVCRAVKKCEKPLGGIQVVMTGDMFQLQSVGDVFLFESEVWEDLKCVYFVLTTFYRFQDEEWTQLLVRCRVGSLTDGDKVLLRSRVISEKELEERTEWNGDSNLRPTMLLPTHKQVDEYNKKALNQLPSELRVFPSLDSVERCIQSDIHSEERESQMITPEAIKKMNSVFPVDVNFQVKVGCQLMLRRNLSVEYGLVNGSRGIVTQIRQYPRAIQVAFERYESPEKCPISWEALGASSDQIALANEGRYHSNLEWIFPIEFTTSELVSTFPRRVSSTDFDTVREIMEYKRLQFPLTLSASVTIHSCQGITLSSIIVDIGNRIFSMGQSYVALSRCKTLQGVYILNLDLKKIRADHRSKEYEANILKKAIMIE